MFSVIPHVEINLLKASKSDFTGRSVVNTIGTARVQQHVVIKK